MRTPNEYFVDADGLRVCIAEWPGGDPAIFFIHATGFHRRLWDQVVARLPGRHCYAMDARGHGLTEKTQPPFNWRQFTDDAAAVVRALGLQGAIGCGHSGGGHAVAWTAALNPGVFRALLLVDPTILPLDTQRHGPEAEPHFAARRRNNWASPQEMFDAFKDRKPFDRWDPAALRDYCEHGLVPNPAGEGYVLACPPHIEAAVYGFVGSGNEIYADLAKLDVPVRILRATPRPPDSRDMSFSPCNPEIARHIPGAVDTLLEQHSHFIPMENPGLIAAELDALLRANTPA
jgi:pimeloyl-ACP methyl ester carboxylesterase